jgi:hypothetical protein
MKRLIVALSALFIASPALAQEVKWFPYKSDEFKIQVCLNTGMKVQTRKVKQWGVLFAKEGDVSIVLMALKGTASFEDMQKIAVAESKIPGESWKTARTSAKWNGFGKNATYLAEGADRIAIAFLAKHGTYVDRNYIVFVSTSKANFVARKAAFNAWGNCLHALP